MKGTRPGRPPRRGRLPGTALALLLVLAPLPPRAAPPASEPLAVIVHERRKESSLTLRELRDLFLKRRSSWSDGTRVLVVNWTARTAVREAFDLAVLKLTPDQSADYWVDQRIRGFGEPPPSVASPRLLAAIVSRQPTAIAYLPLSQVGRGVKVLKVDGKRPQDAGYPIRWRGSR